MKDVSDKATQNVPLEEKEDIGEEVLEGKKEEKEEMDEEEDKIDIKNVSQALPLRRSARAARRAIVKVDQVRLFPCRPPFLPLPFSLDTHFSSHTFSLVSFDRSSLRYFAPPNIIGVQKGNNK